MTTRRALIAACASLYVGITQATEAVPLLRGRERQHRTIDVGVGILSMHSPMDVSAVDLWELYRGFKAFWSAPSSRTGAASFR